MRRRLHLFFGGEEDERAARRRREELLATDVDEMKRVLIRQQLLRIGAPVSDAEIRTLFLCSADVGQITGENLDTRWHNLTHAGAARATPYAST